MTIIAKQAPMSNGLCPSVRYPISFLGYGVEPYWVRASNLAAFAAPIAPQKAYKGK